MKRAFLIGLLLVSLLSVATYGAWYTGKLGPILRTVGLDSLAQIAELTQVSNALQERQENSSTSDTKTSREVSQDSARDDDANVMEEAVGLALKGVNLVQGEKGLEIWRLNASWASLREEGGQIDVEMPDMVYRVGDAEIPLHVTAHKGQIERDQQFLRLWEDVVCVYDEYTLRATLMTYDGTTRTMTFPEGAHIESDKNQGFAQILTWDMNTNIINGMDGVSISW